MLLGTRAIVLARADFVTAKKVLPDQVAGLRFDDIRILPVQFDAQRIRRREFNVSACMLHESVPQGGDLQLQGPASPPGGGASLDLERWRGNQLVSEIPPDLAPPSPEIGRICRYMFFRVLAGLRRPQLNALNDPSESRGPHVAFLERLPLESRLPR